jgi:predicted TIM-barrel fold metal-dependent hydrolase
MGLISVHLHPPTAEFIEGYGTALERMGRSLRAEKRRVAVLPIEAMIEDMDAHGIDMAVVLPVDARSAFRDEFVPNTHVADLVRQYPDRIIGFCSVDPSMGQEAIKALEHAVGELGLSGLKLDATKQRFNPTERRYYDLYARAEELGLPVTFHTGWSPGFELEYGNPVLYDRIAEDFPELRMNLAHFGWPWAEECMAIAWNRKNVFFDIAAWRPSYIPPNIVHFINTVNQDKALFSHDFPVIPTATLLKELEELRLKPDVLEKLTVTNPRRFLGLDS